MSRLLHRARVGLLLSDLALALAGCTTVPTYTEAQATAQVIGCWPNYYPTPLPVTVTPGSAPSSATALPTTTPYPRCPPPPGASPIPWPSPVPAPKPYPTMAPEAWQGGGDELTTFHLPGQSYQIDLAVHPTEGWPVVAVMQRLGISTDPVMTYVRVYNPHAGRWSVGQQVDVGTASNGSDRFGSIVVGVTGAGEVIAAWGSSDGDGGIWTSSSTDYGTTWSQPERIATDCWVVNGIATTPDGQAVVLASGYVGAHDNLQSRARLIVRRADGSWLAPATVGAPGWFGSIVMVGDGADARAVALTTSHAAPADVAYLISKRLSDGGAWQVQTRALPVPGAYHLHQRGLVFAQSRPDGSTQPGIIFTWHGQYRASAYALVSTDAGQSWGNVETIIGSDAANHDEDAAGVYVTPAYDAAAKRLVALWTKDGTHYASWSTPGSGRWQTLAATDTPLPLVDGARQGGMLLSAQTMTAQRTWIAWIEQHQQLEVRSLDLNQIVPVEQYPTTAPAEVQP